MFLLQVLTDRISIALLHRNVHVHCKNLNACEKTGMTIVINRSVYGFNLKYCNPSESDIVERYCAVERIYWAGATAGVIRVPVHARRRVAVLREVAKHAVVRTPRRSIAAKIVISINWNLMAFSHSIFVVTATYEVLSVFVDVKRRQRNTENNLIHRSRVKNRKQNSNILARVYCRNLQTFVCKLIAVDK
jgi:hypothetical protein